MSQPQVPRPGHNSLLHAVVTALLVIAATPSIAGADGPEGAFVGASVGVVLHLTRPWRRRAPTLATT